MTTIFPAAPHVDPLVDVLLHLAVSVGIARGVPVLDLTYAEDAGADVDANVVMTSAGEFVEIQTTAEGAPFGRDALDSLLLLAELGLADLFDHRRAALERAG